MKTERPTRPLRPPDWICDQSGFFWWFKEMLYHAGDPTKVGEDGPWELCLKDGQLWLAEHELAHTNIIDKPRAYYFPGVDEAYRAWLVNEFIMKA